MSEPFPKFTYHPDPLGTGSIVSSDEDCECCGKARGYKYDGTPYCEAEPGAICPWCIADGSARRKLGAEFTDRDGIGDDGAWGTVSDAIADTVAYRTPGFSGWQQERWWVCCDDAAVFLGPAGKDELEAHGVAAIEAVRADAGVDGDEWEQYRNALNRDKGPTAYIFQCRHCKKLGGYTDCH